MTDADLAARLGRDLGALGTDAGWSTSATAGQEQGHYTDPITDAKDAYGVTGDLDAAELATQRKVQKLAFLYCLDRLQVHYAALVDTSEAGLSQSWSQIADRIHQLRGRFGRGVQLRGRRRPDYTLDGGDQE